MKEAVAKFIDMLTQEDFHGAFHKLLERYNKYIAAGGDYFEEEFHVCTINKSADRKKVWKLVFNQTCLYIYIYIYIYGFIIYIYTYIYIYIYIYIIY